MANGAARIAAKHRAQKDLVKKYPFVVEHNHLYVESSPMQEWCINNCQGEFLFTWMACRFSNRDDAVFYKMVWT